MISILIPTFNRQKYIIETLESCFKQTYKDFEVIVYDDGSTDNTANLVHNYKMNLKNPDQINYIKNNKNNGVGYARNVLLDSIKGDYACWLDSDDLMNNQRLEKSLDYLINNNFDIIYSSIQRFDSFKMLSKIVINTDVYNKNNFESLKNNTTCATAFFKKELNRFRFLYLKLSAEDVMWLWELIKNDVKIGYINEPLYLYRNHNERLGVYKRNSINASQKENENKLLKSYI